MTKSQSIRVLIVDDHKVVRVGLRTVLEDAGHIEVVGEAGTAAAALAESLRLRPDVLLMDVRLPDGSGLEACRRIKDQQPQLRVLVLTSFADDRLVLEAIEAGADGYLVKDIDGDAIIKAIETVAAGGAILDPAVVRRALGQAKRDGARKTTPSLASLTHRETGLLKLVAEGKTNKEIADELRLSEGTVRNYLSEIFAKLEVHRRAQATALYLSHRQDRAL